MGRPRYFECNFELEELTAGKHGATPNRKKT
jgi:hypothetical protein